MIWTTETTAGRSYTLTSSGFPRTKACCVPCWEWELSFLLLPQVSVHCQYTQTQQHTRSKVDSHTPKSLLNTQITSGSIIFCFKKQIRLVFSVALTHSNSFRHTNFRCSSLITVFLIVIGIIVMALLGMFNVHRHGAINSAAIVLYALTSCVSGYVSCSFYTQINGQRWVWNIILTSSLFSGESRKNGL